MSKLSAPTDVKFFYSILFNPDLITEAKVDTLMSEEFCATEKFEPEFNPLTEYYSHEMGDQLQRILYYGEAPVGRELLVTRKVKATTLEEEHSQAEARSINIDVGYVAKEQVLLATGKPYSHRIYLSDGVYGELVYFFQNKSFHKVPWTYPDYQHQEKIEFFNSIR